MLRSVLILVEEVEDDDKGKDVNDGDGDATVSMTMNSGVDILGASCGRGGHFSSSVGVEGVVEVLKAFSSAGHRCSERKAEAASWEKSGDSGSWAWHFHGVRLLKETALLLIGTDAQKPCP